MASAFIDIEKAGRLDLLHHARACSDELFAMVDAGLYYVRPIPLRHRLIFYLGHLEAFDFNHLVKAQAPKAALQPSFDQLFERGIDPLPGQAPTDTARDWPAVEEVLAYRRKARIAVENALDDAEEDIVHMIVEHRMMHAETLCYMLHELPGASKRALPRPPQRRREGLLDRSPVEVPRGDATLGRRRGSGFGWDNEFDEHCVTVEAFRIDRFKVTNGQYLKYIEATKAPAPHFWRHRGREWFWRGMFESYLLPLEAPVYVTHREAVAYAAWKQARLPTEAEFHRAAYGTPEGHERAFPWGDDAPNADRTHADFEGFDPIDVGATPRGDSAFGAAQMVGNGWEWTSTVFGPFGGFEPHPNYPGYSADFFDGEHFVLKGGSPRTAASLLRRSFRNWFRPDYPYAYATFRCVEA